MAQLALAAVGGAVGGAIGGQTGAGVGFLAGFWFFAFLSGFLFCSVFIGFVFLAFCGLFIAFAPVIGLIESGPFEDYTCSGTDKAFQSPLSTRGTFPDRLSRYALKQLKLVSTAFTHIIVSRHRNHSGFVG